MEPKTVEEVLALLKQQPDDVELYQRLGGLYFKLQEIKKSWQAYMKALELDPDDPFTCLFFGNMLTICDDKKYAMELYEHAIKVKPELAVAHWCKANLHKSQGEIDLAEQEYERAVSVDPDDEQAQTKLAEWRVFIADRRNYGDCNDGQGAGVGPT